MKYRLLLFLRFYAFGLLLFVVQKPIFLLLEHSVTGPMQMSDWLQIVWHGLPLDIATAAYITVPYGLLLCFSPYLKNKTIRLISDIYIGVVLALVVLIQIADIGTYPAWQFRLDKTVFIYLSSPREVLACAEWWVWLLAAVSFVLLYAVAWGGYCLMVRRFIDKLSPCGYAACLVMFVLTALLFLPIRGGVTVSTLNTGRVYFSDNQAYNQAAINPVFNLFESLGNSDFDVSRYTYMSDEEEQRFFSQLMPQQTAGFESIFTTDKPNIFLVILESFSANVIEPLGGEPHVTPHLNRYCNEGVLFASTYASSFRTDRGVVSVLSGFPGQPTASLMTVPSKADKLPFLSADLHRNGYNLKFYYGGDENFTSMRSYLISGGFTERVCDQNFPVNQRLSKWGVHDHLLFNRVVEELHDTPQPFMKTILTLSSHEPFDVPASRRFDDNYVNSVAYTDSCIGSFVEHLRASDLWSNSIVIFVSDHGYPYPNTVKNHEPERYHIPMLMVGGAIKRPMCIQKICSQIDLAPTLLAQLGIDNRAYAFGKNVLDSAYTTPFAFYSFVDGFGLVCDSDTVVYDAKANQILIEGDTCQTHLKQSQAFVQRIYKAISNL